MIKFTRKMRKRKKYDKWRKNKDTYYTQLHLPRTVLTAGEYIDIMSRL